MKRRTRIIAAAVIAFAAGCQAISPEQAVNINEVHDGVGRLMPYAANDIRRQIVEQQAIASDESATHEARSAAENKVIELTGVLLETQLLPEVTAPIRDWAIAHVGTEAYLKAKADRDQAVGANGGH